MLKVSEIMTREVLTATPAMEIAEAARLLMHHQINGLPVVDEAGGLVGILCRSDIIAQQKKLPLPSLFTFLDGYITFSSMKGIEKEARKIAALSVADAMTRNPVTVGPESTIETVAALMVDRNFHTLPVVAEGQLVGVVGQSDVLGTIAARE
ncbi:MAG: CBS domain-containing protein [Desulfosarcinaceae bacterium]|nr:CBS domain-containing protein [Desulfosarcinaceae bacterium]